MFKTRNSNFLESKVEDQHVRNISLSETERVDGKVRCRQEKQYLW